MKDLNQRTIRGGFAKLCGEVVGFVLRMASLVIMARLLDPRDFGLVAMVTAVTGVYGLFISAGLSTATVQRQAITDEQISTLFWINILVGAVLALLCLLTAPMLVRFYNEPRLFWVTVIAATGFIINAAGVQHFALLQRQLRFVALTVIERFSQLVSVIIGITMAIAGFGYWALVAMTIVAPAIATLCVWSITSWAPGLPRRGVGISSMLRFGGTVTLNGLVVYLAYNLEKVLLGRFWGADALGLYGRAYQLINVPTENLNGSIGGVAFSALSRLQNDPIRFRNYFLKGYSLVNSITLPTTMFCALFADDIILLALGPKWTDVVPIFRLLSSDGFDFWHHQSIGLAAFVHWTTGTKLKNCACDRSVDHYGLRDRITFWSERRCICLLGGDDGLACPTHSVVSARYRDFAARPFVGNYPATYLSRRCGGHYFWGQFLF